MRKTKFRVWDKQTKKMIYEEGIFWIGLNGGVRAIGDSGDILNGKSVELLEYTGLHDKNGKEIYEGDVVKYIKHHGYLLDDFIAEVVWKDVQWSFGQEIALAEVDELEDSLLSHVEVIGNIWEHPGLLKK